MISDEQFVQALYHGLLEREPDPSGFAHHVAAVQAGGPHAAAEMIRSFVGSAEFRAGQNAGDLAKVLQVQPVGAPFGHVVSLGSHCYVSQTLKTMRLKRYSLPFDWIFSSLEMAAHCIEDDFVTFLDPRHFRTNPVADRPSPREGLCEHAFYRDRFGVERVFNHFDPNDLQHHAYLVRAVARFRRLLDSQDRKLFLAVVRTTQPDELAAPFHRLVEVLEQRSPHVQLEVLALLPRGGAEDFSHALIHRHGVHTLSALQPLSDMRGMVFGDMIDELFVRRLIARHAFALAPSV